MRVVICDFNDELKRNSKKGISLNSYRMRQGPNAKRSQGRGNGRAGGNSRNQRSGGKGPAVRGNARQIMEKYLTLAREASTSGDRIVAEGYFQHAEHYFRVMTASGRDSDEREHRPQPQPVNVEDQPVNVEDQPKSDPAGVQPARRD